MQPHDHIKDELKPVAPYLASLHRSHPFIVPEGYFEELEIKLNSIISKDENAEIVFGSKEYPFRVPGDYFKELPPDILSKIKNDVQQERKIKPVRAFTTYLHDYKSWLAAASVALILMVSIALFTKEKPAPIALESTTTESETDLLYAAELDESVVVDLYLQDEQESNETYGNDSLNYLREAVELNPDFLNDL